MAISSDPYYSIVATDPDVYYEDCPNGEQILAENKRLETNNWQRCGSCTRLGM